MTATSTTFTVRGHKVRSQSQRRYIVVAVRPEPVPTANGYYVAFARIERRSDNLATARKAARHYDFNLAGNGSFAVVVDSATGEEV